MAWPKPTVGARNTHVTTRKSESRSSPSEFIGSPSCKRIAARPHCSRAPATVQFIPTSDDAKKTPPTTGPAISAKRSVASPLKFRGDEIISIRGDRADPFSRGHICPKAVALQDSTTIQTVFAIPCAARGAGIGSRLAGRRLSTRWPTGCLQCNRHSATTPWALCGQPGRPQLGHFLFGPPLSRVLRTKNRFSATSVDQLPHHVAATLMFGHKLLLPIPDVDRTQFLLVLGANPVVSNGSMMTAPGFKRRLEELRRPRRPAGGRGPPAD